MKTLLFGIFILLLLIYSSNRFQRVEPYDYHLWNGRISLLGY